MTNRTSHTADDVKQKAKDTAADVGDSARETAQNAAGTVRDEAARHAESAKDGVADEVSDVASALRKAADDMRNGSPQERTFSQIAGGLADVSESIRGKDLGEMANELSGFAKRNPMLFLGGMALAGFAATRFATASARRDEEGTGEPNPIRTASSVYADRAARTPAPGHTPATPSAPGGTS